jgi:hypothetical protein
MLSVNPLLIPLNIEFSYRSENLSIHEILGYNSVCVQPLGTATTQKMFIFPCAYGSYSRDFLCVQNCVITIICLHVSPIVSICSYRLKLTHKFLIRFAFKHNYIHCSIYKYYISDKIKYGKQKQELMWLWHRPKYVTISYILGIHSLIFIGHWRSEKCLKFVMQLAFIQYSYKI